MESKRVFLALGSNIGDRLGYLGKAILYLAQQEQLQVTALSSVYETDPVGYLEQDPFYNMVIEVRTSLAPMELLQLCLLTEAKLGRIRTIQNGPRTIDVDLLLYEDQIYQEEDLVLPHPRMHERSFVMTPLAEIAPHVNHPVVDKSCLDIAKSLTLDGVHKLVFEDNN